MAIGPQGVVRSEVEGGLSGPANPIPDQSIDCGCGQVPCPKLARFATRKFFLGLVCTIGLTQAACQAYFYVTSPTMARRFQLNPYLMEWLAIFPEMTPIFCGLLVAYWGDRFHRAAWTGALVIFQSIGYFLLIVPHLTSNVKSIEESENVTHMSVYADDSPELCSPGSSMLIFKETNSNTLTLVLIILVQLFAGMASVAYYALMLSYIDDNTKKKNVAAFIAPILAVKFLGTLPGTLGAWMVLEIDAENFNKVESYQEQIGAWWLGWPFLAVHLFIPAVMLAMFPRRLPSEVVEQAAASILDSASGSIRSSYKSLAQKFGSTGFFASILRLIENKIIIFNVAAAMLAMTALVNFMAHENIFLESRYYIPRPTGMYLGFGDSSKSRLITSIIRPLVVGLSVITAGVIIRRTRLQTSYVAGYNVVALAVAATIFLALAFATCEKPSIVGTHRKTLVLLKYCNKNCRCSRDADFRPVCDTQGKFTFYSACHAGCTGIEFTNDTKYYNECSCVQEMLGLGNTLAVDGPCSSTSCHIGWIIFHVGTVLIMALLASAGVSNIIIVFRSIFPQDKALAVGYHMTFVALFVFVPGKILYGKIIDKTCWHWGSDGILCHLYDTDKLGDYLCYLSAAITLVAVIFQAFVWLFAKDLKLYGYPEADLPQDTELQDVQASPLLAGNLPAAIAKSSDTIDETPEGPVEGNIETRTLHPQASLPQNESQLTEEPAQREPPLRYGPLGPGNKRSKTENHLAKKAHSPIADTEDELSSTDDETDPEKRKRSTEITYRPLEIDSDLESDLSGTGPRSRKNVLSRDFDPVLNNNVGVASFPVVLPKEKPVDPEEDENLRERRKSRFSRSMLNVNSLSPVQERASREYREFESRSDNDDGFSKTDSFEYAPKAARRGAKPKKLEPYRLTGDFNEVGIPTVELDKEPISPTSPVIKIQSIQASQENFQGHMSRDGLDKILSYQETDPGSPVSPINLDEYTLEDVVAEPQVPPLPSSPPPQSTDSSGIGSSLLSDTEEKNVVENMTSKSRSREHLDRARTPTSPSGRKLPPLTTDF